MSKATYVGVNSEIPIYEETITELDALSNTTYSAYFSLASNGSGYTFVTSPTHGQMRFKPANIRVDSSTGGMKLTALHDLTNVKIYCEYCSETNWDKITVTAAGETVMDAVSGTTDTDLNLVWNGDLSTGEIIDCKFVKDSSNSASGEKVYWEITCDTRTETTTTITGYENKDVARKVKKIYASVDGVARKVKKAYVGVDGIAKLFYSADVFGGYTGNYTVSQVEYKGANYNLYTLTSSGTLTLNGKALYWMCGGGQSGESGSGNYNNQIARGGSGGSGGFVDGTGSGDTYSIGGGEQGNTIPIVIGAGGTGDFGRGGDTSYTVYFSSNQYNATITASGGGTYKEGCYGGSGGGSCGYIIEGARASRSILYGERVSTIPFGINSLQKHSGGGGGGGASYRNASGTWRYSNGGNGGSNGGNGAENSSISTGSVASTGGVYGGGNGGDSSNKPQSATFYGGGGGGARGMYNLYSSVGFGFDDQGSGYQGVFYLLIPA